MKTVSLLARVLLGLLFVFFGLNKFLLFLPVEPPSPGLAQLFMNALLHSRYIWYVGALEVTGGVLLLVNRYVPLALTLLGPVAVNIALYHLLLFHEEMSGAIVVVVLWLLTYWGVRSAFTELFRASA